MNLTLYPRNPGQYRLGRLSQCLLLLALWCVPATLPAADARLVRADFLNQLSLNSLSNSPASNASSVAMFSGHVALHSTPGVPTNSSGSLRLVESSFGQAFSPDLPYPDFVAINLSNALTRLYPPPSANRDELDSGGSVNWAFRYKWLLYSSDDTNGVILTEGFPSHWYGDLERANVAAALDILRRTLAYAPFDRTLRHAYLDVFYDQAVAEMQGIKSHLATIAKYRIGEVALGPTEFIIDQEIQGYTNVVNKLHNAMSTYAQIFNDFSGVDVTTLDSTATPGTPFGYFMFQQEQPFRKLRAPQFLNTDGSLNSVLPAQEEVLFDGFKDFVMLMTLLKDSAQYGAELARLYGTRGLGADRTNAYALISQIQTDLPAEVQLLTGMFPPDAFPPGDASGARAAINGVQFGMAELEGVKAFLDGRANPLGFDPNFLVLIQEAPGLPATANATPFDSFDSLKLWLRATPTAPLNAAATKYAAANTAYVNYRASRDQVETELNDVNEAYSDRYFEITGFEPGEPGFWGTNAAPGSELGESTQILSNLQSRLNNLTAIGTSIQSNVSLASLAINDAVDRTNKIDQLLQSYFDSTDEAWQAITDAKTSAAFFAASADAVYGALGTGDIKDVLTGGGAAAIAAIYGAANTAVQTTTAYVISSQEQELERASAQHDANMAALDAYPAVLQAQSDYQALIQSQQSHLMDVQDANAQVNQEQTRQALLHRELEKIRANQESGAQNVASRYYADPIHAFRAQAALIRADQSFRRAQRWVFYTQRALEYKWNKDFSWPGEAGERSYDRGTIFKLRNAQELDDLVGALEDFNTQNLIGFSREESNDRISLVDDLLLPFAGPGLEDTGLRTDPAGNIVTKEALFRRILRGEVSSAYVTVDPECRVIRLDTFALRKKLGTFFNGPRYRTNGVLQALGKHLHKIDWVKFNVVTTNPPGQLYQGSTLSYGGSCYIRVTSPPCTYDTAAPRPLFRAFPFQYFYPDPQNVGAFLSQTHQDALVKMAFSSQSWALPNGVEDPALQNTTLENRSFKELSIAATGLELRIPADAPINLNLIRDIEIWVRHRYVSDLPCTP